MKEDERWIEDLATLRRAAEELVQGRQRQATLSLSKRVNGPFDDVAESLDDPSPEIRQKAVRELY